MLFAIVTLAPPLKSALGGISIPPPTAKTPSWPTNGTDSGLDVAYPPVTVTPLISTVGSTAAPNSPIVMTEPPPLMTVEFAPLPRRRTLLVIVMPPAKVPWPRRIVSPSRAASSAAWIVEKQPEPPPTHRFAPPVGRSDTRAEETRLRAGTWLRNSPSQPCTMLRDGRGRWRAAPLDQTSTRRGRPPPLHRAWPRRPTGLPRRLRPCGRRSIDRSLRHLIFCLPGRRRRAGSCRPP